MSLVSTVDLLPCVDRSIVQKTFWHKNATLLVCPHHHSSGGPRHSYCRSVEPSKVCPPSPLRTSSKGAARAVTLPPRSHPARLHTHTHRPPYDTSGTFVAATPRRIGGQSHTHTQHRAAASQYTLNKSHAPRSSPRGRSRERRRTSPRAERVRDGRVVAAEAIFDRRRDP